MTLKSMTQDDITELKQLGEKMRTTHPIKIFYKSAEEEAERERLQARYLHLAEKACDALKGRT